MSERNFLIKVLGLSAGPRILTFGLTLVSFPQLVRALGADQYGIMVYLGSMFSLLELFASLGVTQAAGKGIAHCRADRPHCLPFEIKQWAGLQLKVVAIGFFPIAGLGYFLTLYNDASRIEPVVVLVVAGTLFVSICVTFVRTVLNSMLAYKLAAVLDTVESVTRSAGWMAVAWIFPTVTGLALAGLVTSIVAAFIGGCFLAWVVKRNAAPHTATVSGNGFSANLTLKHMVKESLSFLVLAIGTRAYQTVPIILIGRLLGFEVTGIIGTFAKVVEIGALPFIVIGNALMARAPEIKARGIGTICRYWDMLLRFSVSALIITCGLLFMSRDIALLLLPKSLDAEQLFSIMTFLVFLRATSDLFAPAADYVGGLTSRMMYLITCAVLQVPLIWAAISIFGNVGAVTSMVVSYGLMVIGYIAIAKRVFFDHQAYRPANDIPAALAVVLGLLLLVYVFMPMERAGGAVYLLLVLISFYSIPRLRKQYISGRFLRFDLL